MLRRVVGIGFTSSYLQKNDWANIDDKALEDFRTLAKTYATLNEKQITQLLRDKDLTEICHGNKKQV